MAALARLIQREHADLERTLSAITAAAVGVVPGTSWAGITLVTARRRLESRAATADVATKLDALQQELGEGPCLHSAWEHETVQVNDLAADERWPAFAAGAVRLGVRSMLSFQLYTYEENLGALNLHSAQSHAFGTDSYDAGITLAAHAAVVLSGARREDQFRSALASRDVIGQAKGMLMERFGIDAVQAFALLTRMSQDTNTPLVEVARSVAQRR